VETLRIRPAAPRDLPFLREMLFEAGFWRPGRARPALAEGLARPDLAKLLAGWGRPGDFGVVAESAEGGPLGAAWYRFWSEADHSYGFVSPDVPELAIGVRAEARGAGVGERLLRALLAAAAGRGVGQLSLSVERDNPALRLYERVGFRRAGEEGGALTLVATCGGGSS
jgi:ribosomal protein S18 acetylase RimI-like enzyme